MARDKIVLSYKGELNGETISFLIEFLDMKLKKLPCGTKVRKKVVNIVIESLQNIYHHQLSGKGYQEPVFVLTKEADDYTVHTGNVVHEDQVSGLVNHIESIKAQDDEGLSKLYRATLIDNMKQNRELERSLGAGVGIIDIARRS